MSIIVLKSKSTPLGCQAYEPKYKRSAVFASGQFIGWSKKEEVRSMIAIDESIQSTLLKAIGRKLNTKMLA